MRPPADAPVLSRHRLPAPFRHLLTCLWLAPLCLFTLALLLAHGVTPALLDPRYLLLLAIMSIPAWVVWREGVDVLSGGIVHRAHLPRFYAYHELETWRLDRSAEGQILLIRSFAGDIVLATHARHLTDLPVLLDALRLYIG